MKLPSWTERTSNAAGLNVSVRLTVVTRGMFSAESGTVYGPSPTRQSGPGVVTVTCAGADGVAVAGSPYGLPVAGGCGAGRRGGCAAVAAGGAAPAGGGRLAVGGAGGARRWRRRRRRGRRRLTCGAGGCAAGCSGGIITVPGIGELPGGITGVPCGVGLPTGAPPTSAEPGEP